MPMCPVRKAVPRFAGSFPAYTDRKVQSLPGKLSQSRFPAATVPSRFHSGVAKKPPVFWHFGVACCAYSSSDFTVVV